MSDYASMTDDELNRQIAERRGYTIYHYDKDYAENCFYMLMDGQQEPAWYDFTGNRLTVEAKRGMRAGERKTEAEAWKDAPDWADDLNAAWRLLDAITADITIESDHSGGMLIRWWDRVWFGAYIDKPARAICSAWLEWFDYRAAHPELFTEEYETYMRISRENRLTTRDDAPRGATP